MSLAATIQGAVVTRLSGHEYFAGAEGQGQKVIPVLAENRKDIAASIQSAVAKLGACVIVGVGRLRVTSPNIPGPRFDESRMICACHENVAVNRGATGSGETALSIAEACARLLHQWKPTVQAHSAGVIVVEDIVIDPDSPLLTYQVICRFSAGIDPNTAIQRTN
jgi:hypothetical protein